jgi:hypothetical protein
VRIQGRQATALEAAELQRFKQNLVLHVRRFFPGHYRAFGDACIRSAIELSVRDARVHGLTTERNVCLYLNIMLMLGAEFERDPQFPWAADILQKANSANAKMDDLSAVTLDFMDRVAGVDNRRINRALSRLRHTFIGIISMPVTVPFEEHMLFTFHHLYPEKAAAVGEPSLQALIRSGREAALRHGCRRPSRSGEIRVGVRGGGKVGLPARQDVKIGPRSAQKGKAQVEPPEPSVGARACGPADGRTLLRSCHRGQVFVAPAQERAWTWASRSGAEGAARGS